MTAPADPDPSGPSPQVRIRDRNFSIALGGIATAAAALRLGYLFGADGVRAETIRQGDAFWYSTTAQAMANGEFFRNAFSGQPTADHPPLTVLLLAPASWAFDGSVLAQRLTMVLLGVVTVIAIGLVGRQLAGPRAGLLASAVATLAPALWVNDVLVMSETPTALMVTLVLGAGIRLAERSSRSTALIAGVLCGLAALARAETGLFLPFMLWPIALLVRDAGWRRRLGLAAIATAGTVAVIAPWAAFNTTRFSEPVAISVNDGLTLLGANCDPVYEGQVIGGWAIDGCLTPVYETLDARKAPLTESDRAEMAAAAPDSPCSDPFQQRPPCWDASKVSSLMRSRAVDYVSGHLSDLPKVVVARHGRVWGWYRLDQAIGTGVTEGRTRGVTRWGFYVTWLLTPAVAAGALVLRRRGRTLVPFVASLAIVVVVTTTFYGLVRFRLPYDVASCLLAGVAFDAAWQRFRPSVLERPAQPTA